MPALVCLTVHLHITKELRSCFILFLASKFHLGSSPRFFCFASAFSRSCVLRPLTLPRESWTNPRHLRKRPRLKRRKRLRIPKAKCWFVSVPELRKTTKTLSPAHTEPNGQNNCAESQRLKSFS